MRGGALDRVDPPKRPVLDRLADFNAVSRLYDEKTASEQASRCVQCPNPNCVAACPLEIPIPELLGLTASGQFREAAGLLFNTQSLPEFVAHICAEKRMCEAACVLDKPSDPVPIGSISRFLLDYGWRNGVKEPPPPAQLDSAFSSSDRDCAASWLLTPFLGAAIPSPLWTTPTRRVDAS